MNAVSKDRLVAAIALVLAACGGAGKHGADATPGGTTVSGPNGFTPTSTLLLPAPIGCTTSGVLSSGELDALATAVADVDLRAPACGNLDISVPHVLLLQLATGGYFTADPDSANEPIVAGTKFSILDEDVTDEDLCGNVPAGTTQPTAIALLEECPAADSCSTQYWATSGSVTVTSVAPTAVAGTFDLVLGDTSGISDGGALTGSFSASTCP
ncbi:MAG TPA: hypothetical protein VLX92_31625 [Kofleriaceae bacterium]|nr:hypothetical protein [Kofleriaceae bacterium]